MERKVKIGEVGLDTKIVAYTTKSADAVHQIKELLKPVDIHLHPRQAFVAITSRRTHPECRYQKNLKVEHSLVADDREMGKKRRSEARLDRGISTAGHDLSMNTSRFGEDFIDPACKTKVG